MKAPVVSNVLPQDIRAVGGFLGQRFDANRAGRLKDALLSEQFIRLHERKNYDDWFWMGEQVGKWLDASAYAALIADDQALLARVEEIVSRLAASQEDDGYLGITSRFHRTPARGMELYEMYYVLHGLLVCYDLLGSEQALLTAQRLGDYIMALWGVEAGQFPLVGPFPGNGHDGGEGTLILEPIALLGQRTGDPRYVDWCERTLACWDDWWAAYGQVRIYDDVTVIEFGDDHALVEMKAVTSLGSLPYAEISPRLVMIPRLTANHLIAELEKDGYTPRKIEN